jgi:pyrroloquinoline quinone biosynthesis protein D
MHYRLFDGARLRFDRARGQHVLLKPEEVTELNESAHEILALCAGGGRSEGDIIAALLERYPAADAQELADDVREFLQEALETQWLTVQAPVSRTPEAAP